MSDDPVTFAPARIQFYMDADGNGPCIHCGTDCSVPAADRRHADDCPFTTGIWLLEEEDATTKCACDECENMIGICCARCEQPINAGDLYRLVDFRTGLLAISPEDGMMICMACAKVQSDALLAMLDLGHPSA